MKSIATESTAGSSPPGSAQSGPGIDHGVRESFPRFLSCPWGGSGATAWSSVTSLCRWCWDKDGGPHGKKSKIDPEVDVSGSSHKTLNLETACTVNDSVNSWEQTVLYEDGRRYKGQWKVRADGMSWEHVQHREGITETLADSCTDSLR